MQHELGEADERRIGDDQIRRRKCGGLDREVIRVDELGAQRRDLIGDIGADIDPDVLFLGLTPAWTAEYRC